MSFYSSLVHRVCDSMVEDFIGSLESFGFRGSSFRGLYTGFLSIDCRQDSSIWSLVVSFKEADSTVFVSLSRESSPSGLDATLGEWRHPADDSALESIEVAVASLEAFAASKDYAGFYESLESAFSSWDNSLPLRFRPLLASEAEAGREVYLLGDGASDGLSDGERGRIKSGMDRFGNVTVSFAGNPSVFCSYNDLYVRFDGDKS